MASMTRCLDHTSGRVPAVLGMTVVLYQFVMLAAGCRVPNKHVKSIRPHSCAECHADITCQWQSSAHAEAWTNPAFWEAIGSSEGTGCFPCHAPNPLLEQPRLAAPTLRNAFREDGVDCHACHASCGAYVGKYSTFGPHPMKQDLTRLPCSDFCGRCHLQEMKEYEEFYSPAIASGPLASCADCHMPRYRDRLTQGHLLSLIHPERAVPDHSFSAEKTIGARDAVRITELQLVSMGDGLWQVNTTLVNQGAGHCIPSGKFGPNEARILVEVLDAENRVATQSEKSLFARSKTSLVPGRPASFTFGLVPFGDASGHRLRLTVERVNEDRTFRLRLAQQERSFPNEP
jgi:nitrate/TMAO reductase-like tetraheme cytochrome c subunit